MATTNPNTSGAKAESKKTVKGLRVVARSAGFRRAGHAFGAEPTEIALADLTKGQIEALRAERELIVTDIEMPAAAEAAETARD